MVLEVISGPMYSGKTEELLRRIRREKIAKKKVILFKPKIDDRYELKTISTHYGSVLEAIPVSSTAEMISYLTGLEQKPQVIGIDEIQFFDDEVINFCLKHKDEVDIIVSSLNLDFRGKPFTFKDSKKHVGDLIVYAQNTSLSAICTHMKNGEICGRNAIHTQRLINGQPAPHDSPLILVGSVEAYEARCHKHHFVPRKEIVQKVTAQNV